MQRIAGRTQPIESTVSSAHQQQPWNSACDHSAETIYSSDCPWEAGGPSTGQGSGRHQLDRWTSLLAHRGWNCDSTVVGQAPQSCLPAPLRSHPENEMTRRAHSAGPWTKATLQTSTCQGVESLGLLHRQQLKVLQTRLSRAGYSTSTQKHLAVDGQCGQREN